MNSRFTCLAALAVIALPALAIPALAGPRDDVKAGAARCDGITDDRTWLDCYYGAAQPLRAQLGLAPAPGTQQALVPPPKLGAPAPAAAFQLSNTDSSGRPGLFGRLLTRTVVKPEPPTRMASYSFDKSGYFTVTLANGEIWKQNTADAVQAKWRAQPASYIVTILPGPKFQVGSHEIYQAERIR
jgi:hypothetical protein